MGQTHLSPSRFPHHASSLLKPLADLFAALRGNSIAIGLSGGADSAMLAVCAAELAHEYDIVLHCVHIHHGLMAAADDWQQHCQQLVDLLSQSHLSRIIFSPIAVSVDKQSGLGIEGAAREARYQAFFDYAQQHQVHHFLLAHHLDDQAETLLLRLLRGSGIKGMQGMREESIRYVDNALPMMSSGEEQSICYKEEDIADNTDGVSVTSNHRAYAVHFYRPWLSIERSAILLLADWFAKQTQWVAVQDESNLDVKYKRGAIRQHLVPVLNEYWCGWKRNIARHAHLMTEAQQMIEDLSAQDFAQLTPSEDRRSFDLKAWRALPAYRQSYVLRYWLALHGVEMPTERRLQEWMRQLRGVHQLGTDRAVKLVHGEWVVSVRKGRVQLIISGFVPNA